MGPLANIKVIEIAGIGPGPFCAMMLADMGAEVIRVDRAQSVTPGAKNGDLLQRGRSIIGVDLKNPEGIALVLDMIEKADVIIEGFRPGVMERLGLGPDVCLQRNPKLVYGRMTGWGQDGPMSQAAGHDIDYIALSGALHSIGREGQRPVPPLNLVGDFGGGGMLLAFGVVAALVERASSGKGQVVDAAMVDGAAALMTMFFSMRGSGGFSNERGTNLLDTGAHFYNTYETSDGKYIALGAIEPQFYAELLQLTGLDKEDLPRQMDRRHWRSLEERLARLFKTKTRAEWCDLLEGSDACFAPVLNLDEAVEHPHNRHRQTFVEIDGVAQPAPAPRFSRTPGGIRHAPTAPGEGTDSALQSWGFSAGAIAKAKSSGALK
jgi:alpha-methylacyl-CoA racemase